MLVFSLVTMIIDVYLMAQGFYLEEDALTDRVKTYIEAIGNVFEALKPLPVFHLLPSLRIGFHLIDYFTSGRQTSALMTA